MLLCLSILLIFTGATYSKQRGFCASVGRIMCQTHHHNDVCGSDGKTYFNKCALYVAKCTDFRLTPVHLGPCKTTHETTNVPTTDGTTISSTINQQQSTVDLVLKGEQLAYDIFCLDLSNLACPKKVSHQICASNNASYPNLCEFDKARCTHRHLQIVKYGHC